MGSTPENFKELRNAGKLSEFWINKISNNIDRDKVQRDQLQSEGWQVKIVWEDDLKRKSTKEATVSFSWEDDHGLGGQLHFDTLNQI